MIVGAMIVGVGGAILSAGGALATGASLSSAAVCYMAGGSASMLAALALGSRRPPPAGHGAPQALRRGPAALAG